MVVREIWSKKRLVDTLGGPQPEGELWSRLPTPRKKNENPYFPAQDSLGEVYGETRV